MWMVKDKMPEWKVEMIPVGKLRKNPFNPRRTFDPAGEDDLKLKDMAQNVRKDGILAPVMVRPWNGAYQVAAGERRRMVAELAGLETIPAVVLKLDDDAMRRLAVVENIHRMRLSDRELEDAIGHIWEQDYGASEDRADWKRLADDFGIPIHKVNELLTSYSGKKEHPALARANLPTKETAGLVGLAKDAPREAAALAEARAKGQLERDDLREATTILRAAPKERRGEIMQQVQRAARVKEKAQREVAQTLKESKRYAEEGAKREWQKALGADEKLLNRTADLIGMVEKLDVTYLNLFTTPEARERAIRVLRKTRDMIDDTLARAEKMQKNWAMEWKETRARLKGG